jgi:hypothetical protein
MQQISPARHDIKLAQTPFGAASWITEADIVLLKLRILFMADNSLNDYADHDHNEIIYIP